MMERIRELGLASKLAVAVNAVAVVAWLVRICLGPAVLRAGSALAGVVAATAIAGLLSGSNGLRRVALALNGLALAASAPGFLTLGAARSSDAALFVLSVASTGMAFVALWLAGLPGRGGFDRT